MNNEAFKDVVILLLKNMMSCGKNLEHALLDVEDLRDKDPNAALDALLAAIRDNAIAQTKMHLEVAALLGA